MYALAQGCVPGSHKANFEMPNEIVRIPTRDAGTEREGQRGDGIHPPVHNPSCPKGSMLIFLEATYHTTLPWTNKEHARRSLLYRYSPKYLHYASEQYATSQPDWVAELTEEQQAVLEPPGMRRPEIGNSGTLTEPLADSRITHPSAAHAQSVRPHPGLADGTGADEKKNPTGSHAYQATRGWNPDG